MLKVHLQTLTLNYKLFHESTKNKTSNKQPRERREGKGEGRREGEGKKGREGREGKERGCGNKQTNERTNERTNKQTSKRTNERANKQTKIHSYLLLLLLYDYLCRGLKGCMLRADAALCKGSRKRLLDAAPARGKRGLPPPCS